MKYKTLSDDDMILEGDKFRYLSSTWRKNKGIIGVVIKNYKKGLAYPELFKVRRPIIDNQENIKNSKFKVRKFMPNSISKTKIEEVIKKMESKHSSQYAGPVRLIVEEVFDELSKLTS